MEEGGDCDMSLSSESGPSVACPYPDVSICEQAPSGGDPEANVDQTPMAAQPLPDTSTSPSSPEVDHEVMDTETEDREEDQAGGPGSGEDNSDAATPSVTDGEEQDFSDSEEDIPLGPDVTSDQDTTELLPHDDTQSTSSTSSSSAPTGCCACLVKGICGKCAPVDKGLLASQMVALAAMGAAVGVFMFNKKDCHGQCILGATYLPGGIMKYTNEIIWCDSAFYACIFGISFLISMVTVNWFAVLYLNIRWLKAQMAVAWLGFAGTAGGSILLLMGLIFWCEQLNISIHCSLEEEGDHCIKNHSKPVDAIKCHHLATYFDDHYKKYDSMLTAYNYAVAEAALMVCASLAWMGVAFLSPVALRRGIIHFKVTGGRRLANSNYARRKSDSEPREGRRTPLHTILQGPESLAPVLAQRRARNQAAAEALLSRSDSPVSAGVQ